jgi:hypothetical protein
LHMGTDRIRFMTFLIGGDVLTEPAIT